MSKQSYDVIVCGGGTAGVAAALSAARLGASVLIVEQLGSLGGTQANGLVTPMMPNYLGDFKLNRGINLEIIESQNRLQKSSEKIDHGDVWYDPLMLAHVLDKLVENEGIHCLFNATLIGAEVEKGTVNSVNIATRAGNITFKSKSFIDSTGDAQLCYYAGAELMGGDENGEHQPMTLRFCMGNIDLGKLKKGLPEIWRVAEDGYLEAGYAEAKDSPLGHLIKEAIQKGILEEDDLGYFQISTMVGRPNELAFNCPRISGLDPLDPFQLSKAYEIGRAKIFRISQFVKWFLPGFEDAYVSIIAPLMGIRETRRVVGEYVLTMEDHLEQRKFPDVIARNRYPVDIHLKKGLDYRKYPAGAWHDIPYRSIVAKGFRNLWAVGRCLSADFVAQSAVRIQPVCRSLGEAAGVAATLAFTNGVDAKNVPYKEIARHLDLTLPA